MMYDLKSITINDNNEILHRVSQDRATGYYKTLQQWIKYFYGDPGNALSVSTNTDKANLTTQMARSIMSANQELIERQEDQDLTDEERFKNASLKFLDIPRTTGKLNIKIIFKSEADSDVVFL